MSIIAFMSNYSRRPDIRFALWNLQDSCDLKLRSSRKSLVPAKHHAKPWVNSRLLFEFKTALHNPGLNPVDIFTL